MADENATNTQCGGKKKAMLAYGIVQISATVVPETLVAAVRASFIDAYRN